MAEEKTHQVREVVRKQYAKVAKRSGSCCSNETVSSSTCCGSQNGIVEIASERLGYSKEELAGVPEGANMGLGCGNPQAIAGLQPGETVLDLGSGGGFDCFLASPRVGENGRVIGVDMTPEMIKNARENAQKGEYENVEFRLGEIEHLPVTDNSVDVILSNCVINLSPDKTSVYNEAFRVLKPGGRLAISDVVAVAVIPEDIRNDEQLLCGCIAGAATIDELETILGDAGFEDIRIQPQEESREFIRDWAPGRGIEDYVVSAVIEAVKPG